MASSSYIADQLLLLSGPAARLLVSLLAGIPLGFVYRKYLYGRSSVKQHVFFTTTGIILFIYNYGASVIHSMISICVAYLLCCLAGGTVFSVVFAYVFYMAYLIMSYHYTASDTYDLSWAMPQCVLTLRLVGLVIDVYDGHQPESDMSEYQKMAAIRRKPDLLEIAAYTYFYGSAFVGPQFPLNRFRMLINGEFSEPNTKNPPDSVAMAFTRLAAGFAYAIGHLTLHAKWPTEFCLSPEFMENTYCERMMYVLLWFRFIVMRYQAVWLFAESVCILNGLGHNLDPNTGEQLWDGVRNIRLTKFELSASFQGIIESFNYNTNQWAFNYCFKRLRFLGNKNLSHILTLSFLALWHGTNSGYFVCFMFEYICIIVEREIENFVNNHKSVRRVLLLPYVTVLSWFIQKLIVIYSCAYGFLPFALLTFNKWWQVYSSLYFNGWVVYGLAYPLLSHLRTRESSKILVEPLDEPVEGLSPSEETSDPAMGEKEE